jgi:hypothetical protein
MVCSQIQFSLIQFTSPQVSTAVPQQYEYINIQIQYNWATKKNKTDAK